MKTYVFADEDMRISHEVCIKAPDEKTAHRISWEMLSEREKNTCGCWTCVDVISTDDTRAIAERERLAYIEGYTEAANLLARLDDMHHALAKATLDYENLWDENEVLRLELRYLP